MMVEKVADMEGNTKRLRLNTTGKTSMGNPETSHELPRVLHTKGTVFADDDLEADNNESSTICTIMKSVIRCVFQEINIKTDLDDAPVGKSIRYRQTSRQT